MANTTEITVQYERKLSDGQYGSEGLSLAYTATYEISEDLAIDEEMIQARCESITRHLREAVLTELAGSAAQRVAWAAKRELNPPPPAPQAVPAGVSDLEDIPF